MAIDISKYSELQRRASALVEVIVTVYSDFDYYKDTSYKNIVRPAIFWPDGNSLGYGWASHVAGSAQKFHDTFRYWGFNGIEDFYCLPVEKRNEFLINGKAIWKETFRSDQFRRETAHDALNVRTLDNAKLVEVISSLTKAEQEFHDQLVNEAKRIKNQCYSNRRLRWKVRNEKARFRAEDKLRQSTSQSMGRTWFKDNLYLQWFRLQEGIKRLVGLREHFPK